MKYIIVDIDGTISKVSPKRLAYLQQENPDWDKFYEECFDDEPITKIIDIVKNIWYYHSKVEIIFCTGRRESVRIKTVLWLQNNFETRHMKCSRLLMRKDGDLRHDIEVKPELLKESGIDLKDVLCVFEDRNSMVKKWRELGLTVLQTAEGDF